MPSNKQASNLKPGGPCHAIMWLESSQEMGTQNDDMETTDARVWRAGETHRCDEAFLKTLLEGLRQESDELDQWNLPRHEKRLLDHRTDIMC